MPTFHKDAIKDAINKGKKSNPLTSTIAVMTVIFVLIICWPVVTTIAHVAFAIAQFILTLAFGGGILIGLIVLGVWSIHKTFFGKGE